MGPIPETAPIHPITPYGRTKAMVEQALQDIQAADPSWQIGVLRYFNPVGAHESGFIGENPGSADNLMPSIAKVAGGQCERLRIFGNDYPTPDGTGIRDYVHVMDLAEGHVAALDYLFRGGESFTANLGTGGGHSVLEMVEAFEKASGRSVPYHFAARRPGDVATCYADVSKSDQLLGWRARRKLEAMCGDAWRWHCAHSNDYGISFQGRRLSRI
jgi:UDP-glucose 4-epimerase